MPADSSLQQDEPDPGVTGGDTETDTTEDRTAATSTPTSSQTATSPAIRVEGLSKTYGEGEDAVRAVDGVDLTIERGQTVGVLGPNGAGKTTTIKSLLGLVIPDDGRVEIMGVDAHDHPRAVYHHVGAMLEGARNVYWKLSVRENLEFFAALGGQSIADTRARHDELLETFGLAEKADAPVNDLSRGQKQKVSLACTLARGTDVVFLDEPTLGLDVEASLELRRELRRLADELDITVVLSSHDMDVVEDVCDRVVILADGAVIADDQIDDLVNVFDTQAYQIEVADDVPADVRRRLTETFDAGDWSRTANRTTFDVTLMDGDSLYDVLDVLRDADLALLDVDGHDPDLEEVFLEITSNGGGNGGMGGGNGGGRGDGKAGGRGNGNGGDRGNGNGGDRGNGNGGDRGNGNGGDRGNDNGGDRGNDNGGDEADRTEAGR